MKHLILSPHFDDAVLSLGALINNLTKKGEQVTVVTICAGEVKQLNFTKLAQKLHSAWNLTEPEKVVQLRREEDISALRLLNADFLHLDILDCIYRTDSDSKILYDYEQFENILAYSVSPRDIQPDQIIDLMAKRVSLNEFDTIYTPLAAGGHIDHVLGRLVGELLFQQGFQVVYFDEIYSLSEGSLQKGLNFNAMKFRETYLQIDKEDIDAQISSANQYKSQLPGLEAFYGKTIAEICLMSASFNQYLYEYSTCLWVPVV